MERARKARGPVRTQFTKTINDIQNEMQMDTPDKDTLRVKIDRLGRLIEELHNLDSTILDLMLDSEDCTEEDLNTEREAIYKYDDEWTRINLNLKRILTPSRPNSPVSSVSNYSTANGVNSQKSYKLPKIEIKKFNGELTEWLGWWAQFQKIHEDESVHAADKFQYLVQATVVGTRPRKIVESYPQSAENYPKVIETLKDRFGDPVMLTEVYVRKLLKLVVVNATKAKNRDSITTMYEELESNLRALESLGITTDHSAAFLYPMVESSLPEDIMLVWQRSPLSAYGEEGVKSVDDRLKNLMKFLKTEVKGAERISYVKAGFEGTNFKVQTREQRQRTSPKPDIPTAAGLFTGQYNSCLFCDKPHVSSECGAASTMSLQDKRAKLKEKGSCFFCFRKYHGKNPCKSFLKCPLCLKKHFAIMCPESNANKPKEPEGSNHHGDVQTVAASLNCTNEVLLKTVKVKLVGEGIHHVARLIFDDGSQRTYIKESTAKLMKYKSLGSETMRKSLFGGTVTDVKSHQQYQIKVASMDGKIKRNLIALDEPKVCGRIPSVSKGPWLRELKKKNIWLTDYNTPNSNPEIEILVGSDYWGSLMTGKFFRLSCGLIAMESVFGWTISGVSNNPKNEESHAMSITTAMLAQPMSIENLWSLETIGIKDSAEIKSAAEKEDEAKTHFIETVSRAEDGRYVVQLPWVNGPQNIPDNKSLSEMRLKTTTKKLKEKEMFNVYDGIFRSWMEEGIVELVPSEDEAIQNCHYLPHHAVYKESLTTPVRPVFDASAKNNRSPSLNDCLYKGPNLLELIPSVLLRFRENKIGVTADIRKAFQMIEVAANDRNYLRFLWWEDPHCKKLKTYRHKRVVFGVNCSPFLLGAVIEHHLNQNKVRFTDLFIIQLQQSLYVDNCVTSVSNVEDYENFKQKATELMAEAKMELRQWECTENENSEVESYPFTSVLGLKWNKKSDTLRCDVTPSKLPTKITKRVILSEVQKIFDPMGFICPVLLEPKMLLQRTWKNKEGWDEEQPEEVRQEFINWYEHISCLNEIEIPRMATGGTCSRENWQLHTFSDASQDAYAACTFLRTEYNNMVSVQLLQAKARVAPLKKATIPRLELLGCLIAARLGDSVKKALALENIPTYYWSDSTTALAWIRRNDEWGTFVGNRVKEICNLTEVTNWKHVPGILNPADLPSRGCRPKELVGSRWWEGPEWLRAPQDQWITANEEVDEMVVAQEKKKNPTATMMTTTSNPWFVCKFSSYLKNVRVMAYVRRFVQNIKIPKVMRPLDLNLKIGELREAEKYVLKIIQESLLISSHVRIKTGKLSDGLIHVKSKLTNREDTDEFRLPILLPSNHPLVEQLITEVHKLHCHAGTQFLMGKLREKYWILRGRKTVRKVIRLCVKCRRHEAKPFQVESAALPIKRVTSGEVFQTTGIDLAGPIHILENKKLKKVWIVLFTCAVYRGVHLDLVDSLSTEAFIIVLERFIHTYGRPNTVYSDNGTNFVGAVNLFKKLDWTKIEMAAHVKRIQWIFIPPTAAWWGGWWERMVRSVKELLKRMLDKSKLNSEELRTCLSAVAATINDRPLTTVNEDSTDLIPLTPSMFMKGTRNVSFPEGVEISSRELQSQYKRVKILQKDLQARFRKEYLSMLVQKSKEKKTALPQIGDVVLVGADNKKRFEWPLGRIVELYPGKDGEIRVAKVQTQNGVLIRPLQRLYPLEVPGSEKIIVPEPVKVKEDPKTRQVEASDRGSQEVATVDNTTTRSGRNVKKPCRYGQWFS